MLQLSTTEEKAEVRNNIVHADSGIQRNLRMAQEIGTGWPSGGPHRAQAVGKVGAAILR